MSTFSNTAREVEMPNGDIVKLHDAVTPNSTSNIKKFKYDDNGHVTESEAANATDLNLNSYATPTSGTTAIGTSDNVQTAIGKLDHQGHIDQTNIWYVSEHNANRNLLLNTASTTTIDGVTFTVNADKSVTITGSQNNPSKHTKLVLGKFTANRSDLVLDSGIAASASANIFINTQDGVTTTRNLGHATITGTDLNTERDYQILVIAGTSNINTTIKPMICTQADWNATQEYESSGGLPNSDLTQLEAEDRAALAEVVDSGAKNLVQVYSSNKNNAVATLQSDGNTIKLTGTVTTDTSLIFGDMVIQRTGSYRFKVEATGTWVDIGIWDSTTATNVASLETNGSTIVNLISGHHYVIFHYNPSSITLNATVNVLVCSTQSFVVSSDIPPYRYPIKSVFCQYQRITTNTTISTTGIYCKIPSNGIYRFTALAAHSNSVPVQVAIYHKQNSSATAYLLTANYQATGKNDSLTLSGIVFCESGGEIILASEYQSSSQNTHGLVVEKVADLNYLT